MQYVFTLHLFFFVHITFLKQCSPRLAGVKLSVADLDLQFDIDKNESQLDTFVIRSQLKRLKEHRPPNKGVIKK